MVLLSNNELMYYKTLAMLFISFDGILTFTLPFPIVSWDSSPPPIPWPLLFRGLKKLFYIGQNRAIPITCVEALESLDAF
jgi:hypothetical protein